MIKQLWNVSKRVTYFDKQITNPNFNFIFHFVTFTIFADRCIVSFPAFGVVHKNIAINVNHVTDARNYNFLKNFNILVSSNTYPTLLATGLKCFSVKRYTFSQESQ